ncbi:MAG: hypothetical protein HQL95_08365 [Magnetococcales bacterium]|nr:hypothetical protein [Magnetococcales bacterium]
MTMLDKELFDYSTDDLGRKRPVLRATVSERLLRVMGLHPGNAEDDKEEVLRETHIPIRSMREVRESCPFTAEFGIVEKSEQFQSPVQLVTIPCRSPSGDGRCMRTGDERPCPLFGALTSVETPEKERVNLIVAPVLPGAGLSAQEQGLLSKKREIYQRSLRLWEDALAPVHMFMDATTRGVQFWLRSWFGK